MRDMKLTGEWSGYEFRRGVLVSPEGHEFRHDDLRWLSLTVNIKREWQNMMDENGRRDFVEPRHSEVLYFRDGIYRRYKARKERERVQAHNQRILGQRSSI